MNLLQATEQLEKLMPAERDFLIEISKSLRIIEGVR